MRTRLSPALAALAALALPGAAQGSAQDEGGVPTLGTLGVHDATAEGRAALRLSSPRPSVWLGETLRVTWRVELERALADELVQLFARPLDLSVQIQTGGLDALGEPLAGPAAGPETLDGAPRERVSLALDERVVEARPAPAGPGRVAFELSLAFRPAEPLAAELEGPLLRFASATRFRDDLLRGRVPLDRQDAFVRAEPLALRVAALPEEGRPPEFSGLVGSLEARATVVPPVVRAGEPVRLVVALASDGDLERLVAPRLDAPGWRVQGVLRRALPDGLELVYDLVPGSAAPRAAPDVRFVVFDPEAARYRTVVCPGPPLEVLPPAAPPATPAPATDARPWRPPALVAAIVAIGALLAALAAVRARRARAGRVADDALERRRRAAELLRARATTAPADELAHAFVGFLAALLDAPEASVHVRGLRERLEAAGVPSPAAGRAPALLERLLATRYGGRSDAGLDAPARAELERLAAELVRPSRGAARPLS